MASYVMHIPSLFFFYKASHKILSNLLKVLLLVCCITMSGCGTADPRWAVTGWIDRKTAESDAKQLQVCDAFSIGPLTGKGWLPYHKDSSNVMIRADGGKTFAYELNAFTIPLTNSFASWEAFAAYVRDRRTPKKYDAEVIEQSFRPTQRFGKMELEYYVKMRFIKYGAKYFAQYRGYDFIHPISPNLHINLAYNEIHLNDETNAVRWQQAEEFFATFRAK